MTKKAALYARVSTPHQEQEATIESQVAAVETYAQENGYTIEPAHYFLDLAVSGAKLERPALDRLRNLAGESLFATILILTPDRLARQYAHQWVLLHELQKAGVDVVFIDQPDLSDDPQGQLFLGIKGLFAEYERAMITERLRRGKLYRIQKGDLVSPTPPYGYNYIPVSQPSGGRWEIYPVEATVVRQIYQWGSPEKGLTITKIVQKLNELGEKAPPRGKRWRFSTVQAILKQSAYKGQAYYNRTRSVYEVVGQPRKCGRGLRQTPGHVLRPKEEWISITVPALLSKQLWEAVQEQLAMNQKFASRNNRTHFYLLRSLLVCDVCNHTLIGKMYKESVVYRCNYGGKRRDPGLPAHSTRIRGHIVDPLVWEAVSNLLQNPALLADAWSSEVDETTSNPGELDRLQSRKQALERQWTRLLDLYQEGLLDKETLAQRKKRLDTEREQLSGRLQLLQQQARRHQVKDEMLVDFDAYCQDMRQRLHNPTIETKQEVIRLLIDHIIVRDDEIVIKHVIPVDDDFRLLPRRK